MSSQKSPTTRLLDRLNRGDESAAEELAPLVYQQLYEIAHGFMRDQRRGHTLQPTALVHEAWLRLVGGPEPGRASAGAGHAAADGAIEGAEAARSRWESERHFLSVAARAMRHILVDHARARAAQKRGARSEVPSLDELVGTFELRSLDLVALDQALERLQVLDPDLARIVELRFFAGLSIAETAHALAVSTPTIERGWRSARAWLRRELPDAST